jgi:peptidyl-prolyl cis-trans isomerase D
MLDFLRGDRKHIKVIWWILIVVTVVTFVFLFGAGTDLSFQQRGTGAVGIVNGQSIGRTEWQQALDAQRADYRQRFGIEPTDRDAKMLEIQAWRGLLTQYLMTAEAKRLGLRVSDREVVLSLQSAPPQMLANEPAFQTNGKFDAQKYVAALRDPNNNWAPIEDMIRQQLPMRKLQERLMSSIKISEPELRETFHDRFDRASASVVFIPAASDTATPSDADLQAAYERYKTRFAAPARTQLEFLLVPKQIGDDEVRQAREIATSYVARVRAGESFADLARDYSEGPGADQGGLVDRAFGLNDFGPEIGPKIAAMNLGDVADPFRDGTRFIIFKLAEKTPGPAGPTFKVAQIVTKIHPNEETMRKQFEEVSGLARRAKTRGLGTVAAEAGFPTGKTEFYDANAAVPQALFGVPDAADWGLNAKQGEVSPVFQGVDEFAVVQVATQRKAGIAPREDVAPSLRQLAALARGVKLSKPTADRLAAALAGGQPLEQAAAAVGQNAFLVENFTRAQPDPRIGAAPELSGALFGSKPGATVGPIEGINGWYFGRLQAVTPADTSLFNQMKGQVTRDILQKRQAAFFNDYMVKLRERAKVQDLRAAQ